MAFPGLTVGALAAAAAVMITKAATQVYLQDIQELHLILAQVLEIMLAEAVMVRLELNLLRDNKNGTII